MDNTYFVLDSNTKDNDKKLNNLSFEVPLKDNNVEQNQTVVLPEKDNVECIFESVDLAQDNHVEEAQEINKSEEENLSVILSKDSDEKIEDQISLRDENDVKNTSQDFSASNDSFVTVVDKNESRLSLDSLNESSEDLNKTFENDSQPTKSRTDIFHSTIRKSLDLDCSEIRMEVDQEFIDSLDSYQPIDDEPMEIEEFVESDEAKKEIFGNHFFYYSFCINFF